MTSAQGGEGLALTYWQKQRGANPIIQHIWSPITLIISAQILYADCDKTKINILLPNLKGALMEMSAFLIYEENWQGDKESQMAKI